MSWTIKSEHPFGVEGCTCKRGRGEPGCPLHIKECEQRQKGCSCWAGYSMPDGSRVDPACDYCYPDVDVSGAPEIRGEA